MEEDKTLGVGVFCCLKERGKQQVAASGASREREKKKEKKIKSVLWSFPRVLHRETDAIKYKMKKEKKKKQK